MREPQPNQGAPDAALAEAIAKRQVELAGGFPKVALFLFDCANVEILRETIDRIPEAMERFLSEIVVMPGLVGDADRLARANLVGDRPLTLTVHRSPRDQGYGARDVTFLDVVAEDASDVLESLLRQADLCGPGAIEIGRLDRPGDEGEEEDDEKSAKMHGAALRIEGQFAVASPFYAAVHLRREPKRPSVEADQSGSRGRSVGKLTFHFSRKSDTG